LWSWLRHFLRGGTALDRDRLGNYSNVLSLRPAINVERREFDPPSGQEKSTVFSFRRDESGADEKIWQSIIVGNDETISSDAVVLDDGS
jgi:hypothetical protein